MLGWSVDTLEAAGGNSGQSPGRGGGGLLLASPPSWLISWARQLGVNLARVQGDGGGEAGCLCLHVLGTSAGLGGWVLDLHRTALNMLRGNIIYMRCPHAGGEKVEGRSLFLSRLEVGGWWLGWMGWLVRSSFPGCGGC